MTDDFARSVQILVQIAGNPEQRLDAINKLTDQINGKKITLNDSISQLGGNANNAAGSLSKVSSATQDISKAATDMGSKGVSAFDKIKGSVSDLNVGVQTLAASLAGIAAGGAISGLAWKQSADFALLDEQIDRAIDNNKKLGIKSEELTAFAKGEAAKGEGTFQENKHELYNMLMAGSKYFKGSSQEKLSQADAIGDFYFSNQEMLKKQGINSAEQLIQTAIRTTGKMSEKMANQFGPAIGLAPDAKEMGSAKSRLKYLEEAGANVDMSASLDKRPWEAFLINVNSLKFAIGDGLAPVMSNFIKILTVGVNLLNKIPGAPALIGLTAGFIALASAATLVNGVVMPGIALFRSLAAAMTLNNLVSAQNLIISKALIVTDWLGITSKVARTTATIAAATATAGLTGAIGMEIVALEADAVATTAAATATTGLAVAEWAALSPLLLIAIPLVALAGLLYLVETRTHVFSNALKQLSETQLSKDIAKWFQDIGYWAGYAIDRLGFVIGSDFTNSIKTLDNFYNAIKSPSGLDAIKMGFDISLGPIGIVLRNGIPLIQKYLELISNNISSVEGLLDIGWKTVSGIYNAIINLPQNIWKFINEGISSIVTNFQTWISDSIENIKSMLPLDDLNTTIENLTMTINNFITSIKEKLPSWLGGGTSNSLDEQGVIDLVKNMKFDDGSRKFDMSDELLKIAYKEALTGTPQEHPNLTDPGKYDKLVAKIADVIRNPALYQNLGSYDATNAIAIAKSSGIVSGPIFSAEESKAFESNLKWANEGYAKGGFVEKSGFALVHSGEPIIPAEVASSSKLQSILENIAYGGSSTSSINNDPIINIYYNVDPRNGIMMSEADFERKIRKTVSDALRQKNGY